MIKQDIQNAIFSALKEKKVTDLRALRFILSQIKYAEIDKQEDLTDEETVTLLQKEIKKRREAIGMFKKGKRNDLVEDEEKQIVVIQRYLPKQLSENELSKIIDKTLSSLGEKPQIGQAIGLVMGKVKGRADGATVANLVKQKLT